jgi:glycosyltransferase involved in cell wall biosynthesis
MKFLTIRTHCLGRYGSENHMLRVAFDLAKQGIEVHAAFPRAEGTASMAADCEAAGVPYRPFDCDARTVASRCRQVRRLLEEVRPDVVQITAGWPDQVIEPALGCALMSVPMLAVFQLAPPPIALPQYCLKRLAWARSRRHRWMAVSQDNLRHLEQTFATRKREIGVLYNGITIRPGNCDGQERALLRRDVRRELGVPDDARLLLTTSRLDPQKGHADLLAIVPEVIGRFPEVRFVWAGDGTDRRRLESEIQRHKLQEHVRVLGYRTDTERLLDASDLFVFPTHLEGGCSSSIREAMVHKIPIVSSDAGGIPEVLVDGSHALLFHVQDIAMMRAKVNEALANPAPMRSLAERARLRIEDFSSERMVENYLVVLRKLHSANG